MDNYIKSRYAFLFQGVGLEYQKFIHLLDEGQKELLHQYCNIVNSEIKLDLWNYLFNAAETKHPKMFNDWIAIYTIDNIVYRTYIDYEIKPEIFLGYSMGLIIAMACGGSISFADGVHMLLRIYEYPREALRKDEAIAVVTGMTMKDIDELIHKTSLMNCVEIASENSEYCIVISGKDDAVKKLKATAIDEGALMVKEINAPYAFHSSFAAGGIDKFIEFVSKLEVQNSEVPIISCYSQSIISDEIDLKKELVKNMVAQMKWKTSIEKIAGSGINNFVEVSLGDMLTRFSRMINSEVNFITYNRFIKSKSKIICSGAEDETFVS